MTWITTATHPAGALSLNVARSMTFAGEPVYIEKM
jgi:hypothetical protein